MILRRAKKKVTRKYLCNLWGRPNATVLKRNFLPGQHAGLKVNMSDYALRLKAKQKVKIYYGDIRESQMIKIYKLAMRTTNKGLSVFQFLERSLATIVYRSGWSISIFGSRQLVNHNHVLVNGKVVRSPLYQISENDVVTLSESMHNNEKVQEGIKSKNQKDVPHLVIDNNKLQVTLVRDITLLDLQGFHHFDVAKEIPFLVEWYARRC
jgi:small subunit ribosomal protein S4